MSATTEAAAEAPFQVSVTDAELEHLHKKLELFRPPDELEEAGWAYGIPLADIQRLVIRWKNGFDWRKAEAEINRYDQFTRDIEVDGYGTLNIHYVHQKSDVSGAIPMLFLHGCRSLSTSVERLHVRCPNTHPTLAGPGHFLEAQKLVPLLTVGDAKHPSFHLVIMSLPGFGFSQAPRTKGFSLPQYAEVSNSSFMVFDDLLTHC